MAQQNKINSKIFDTKIDTSSFYPEDFFFLAEPRYEREIQRLAVDYFRRFVEPLVKKECRLIVNPFSNKRFAVKYMNQALEEGFGKWQPDLLFVYKNVEWKSGLALELKTINRQGKKMSKHEKDQSLFLEVLEKSNFTTSFCYGLKDTLTKINDYFKK